MENIQSNIEELKKILKEIYQKWEEATEFLEAVETNVADLQSEIRILNSDNDIKSVRIDELEGELGDMSFSPDSKIDCGIGVIEYLEPDNIALQDVMENLNGAIQKTNFKKVNELLSAIS